MSDRTQSRQDGRTGRQGDRQASQTERSEGRQDAQSSRQASRTERTEGRQDTQSSRQQEVTERQQSRQDYKGDAREDWQDYSDDYHGRGWGYAAAGAAVVAGAYAVGSVVSAANYRSLSCTPTTVVVGGVSYSQCGSTWYQPTYSGGDVTYVVVNPPAGY